MIGVLAPPALKKTSNGHFGFHPFIATLGDFFPRTVMSKRKIEMHHYRQALRCEAVDARFLRKDDAVNIRGNPAPISDRSKPWQPRSLSVHCGNA